ncbi:MAG: AbrB/MazE/SpoVT family DNA-binding domain-containing protein [Candidatus Woesearchaeota archaeon]
MNRKIIKLAEKTLVISLPSNWISLNELKKGDEIDISILDNKLLLSPLNKKPEIKQITIDIKGISERILRWEIASLHKQGYDEIIITSYNEEQVKTIEDLIDNLFIGFIIKQKTNLKLIIGQIAVTDANEFDSALRRTFRQLITMSEEMYESIKNQDNLLLLNQINLEHENNKLTNFCCRLLNKNLREKEDGHFWYMLAWNLETIGDSFKYIAKHYKVKIPKVSNKLLKFIQEVNNYLKLYYECFYNFSFNKLVEANDIKIKLEEDFINLLENSPKEELVLLHNYHMILTETTDFSGSMIALRHRK